MLKLRFPKGPIQGTLQLPLSKSLVNRQLILAAQVSRLPDMTDPALPVDIRLLASLLQHHGPVWDAGAGGTTLRFLTAYLALSGADGIVTGSSRMQQRPIAPLMHGLEQLGVQYFYSGITGCPPVLLNSFAEQKTNTITLDPSSSSQYLTAILLASPLLPDGLTIQLANPITSKPYFEMTIAVLKHWGIEVHLEGNTISVVPQQIKARDLVLEADWTAASYAFAILALSPKGSSLKLPGLHRSGLQGDQVIVEWMTSFGIETQLDTDGMTIHRAKEITPDELRLDFSDAPDLAQTMIVLAAIYGIPGHFTGMHTLRIKETDRTVALQLELQKVNVLFEEDSADQNLWHLSGKASVDQPEFATYHDHRMAMSLSLMAHTGPVSIQDPEVVEKSFPDYWKELSRIGFLIERD